MGICKKCGKNMVDIYIGTDGEYFLWLPWCKCGYDLDAIRRTKTMVEIKGGIPPIENTSPLELWEVANEGTVK